MLAVQKTNLPLPHALNEQTLILRFVLILKQPSTSSIGSDTQTSLNIIDWL